MRCRNYKLYFRQESAERAGDPKVDPCVPRVLGAAVLGAEPSAGALMYPCVAHGARASLRGTPVFSAFRVEKPSNFMDFPIDFSERLCYTVILDIEVT